MKNLLTLLLFLSAFAARAQAVRVLVNGEPINFASTTAPENRAGTVMVPANQVFSRLNFAVSYNATTRLVTATKPRPGGGGSYSLTFTNGAPSADPENLPRNSLIAMQRDGVITGTYDKWHLVPFGEFLCAVEILGLADDAICQGESGSVRSPHVSKGALSVHGALPHGRATDTLPASPLTGRNHSEEI